MAADAIALGGQLSRVQAPALHRVRNQKSGGLAHMDAKAPSGVTARQLGQRRLPYLQLYMWTWRRIERPCVSHQHDANQLPKHVPSNDQPDQACSGHTAHAATQLQHAAACCSKPHGVLAWVPTARGELCPWLRHSRIAHAHLDHADAGLRAPTLLSYISQAMPGRQTGVTTPLGRHASMLGLP
jgi:hypothetical protein